MRPGSDHEACTYQNLDAAQDGLQRNFEMRSGLRDEQIVPDEPVEDLAPHRV